MDALTKRKIDNMIAVVTRMSLEKAKYYLKQHKLDISNQYTTLAEQTQKVQTMKEAKLCEMILVSLNTLNDLIERSK